MSELPNIPKNIDNCINYCPGLANLIGSASKTAAFCIKHQCPGPIVQERIVDISDVSDEELTATTLVRVCGANLSTRSHTGTRPVGYIEIRGSETDDVNIADDETVLIRELTQEEIRKELSHRTY